LIELPINSAGYWNQRFRDSWETDDGPGQSRYFAELAVNLMPGWLREAGSSLAWCDFGCAQGDGTAVLAQQLGAQVSGTDVAAEGIATAVARYPELHFSTEDWLERGASNEAVTDVVFSSNTLEHFTDPGRVLAVMSGRARRAVVALLPFRERDRIEEHHVSFDPAGLPAVLPDGKVLAHLRVRDVRSHEPCFWSGEQALVVWADPAWLTSLNLTAADLMVEGEAEPALSEIRERLEHSVDVIRGALDRAPEAGNVALEQVRGSVARWVWLRTQGVGIVAGASRARIEAERAEAERILALVVPSLAREEAVAKLLDQIEWREAEQAAERAQWLANNEAINGQTRDRLRGLETALALSEEQVRHAAEIHARDRAALAEAQRLRDASQEALAQEGRRAVAATEALRIANLRLQELKSETETRFAEIVKQIRSDEASLATARLRLSALDQQNARLEAEAGSLSTKLEAASADLVEARSGLDEERIRTRALEETLKLTEQTLRDELQDARLAEADLRARALGLHEALSAESALLREKQSEVALRDAALVGVRERLAAVEEELAILIGSRSWRVTRPLRAAARWVRRMRGTDFPAVRRKPMPTTTAEFIPRDAEMVRDPGVQPEGEDVAGGVIHLVEHFAAGGLERVALDLADRMGRSGRNVAIAVARDVGPIAAEAKRQGVEVVQLGNAPEALSSLVARLNASTVVAHHSYLGWREARAAGAGIIEVLHNAYHWQRGVDVLTDLREDTGAHCVAVSRWVRDFAIEHLGVPAERVALVNNGLNRAGFIRPPLSILSKGRLADVDNAPCFLFMANLQLQKNHLLVIAAFAKLLRTVPGARLVMAGMVEGDCPMARAVLAAAAPMLASGHLRITGSLDRRGLSRELAKAHVALLPTQYEGFSIATLEFAYFGLPSVLSRTGASVELSERYGHVVLCEGIALGAGELDSDSVQQRFYSPSEDDVESLRAAMTLALTEYPRLLDAALDVAADYRSYDIDAVSERYCELLKGEWN
jgi:glycosyltransferase involved in cell wall biosynthesis/predicted transcriptional regulator